MHLKHVSASTDISKTTLSHISTYAFMQSRKSAKQSHLVKYSELLLNVTSLILHDSHTRLAITSYRAASRAPEAGSQRAASSHGLPSLRDIALTDILES
jgi:hypothetical protein